MLVSPREFNTEYFYNKSINNKTNNFLLSRQRKLINQHSLFITQSVNKQTKKEQRTS